MRIQVKALVFVITVCGGAGFAGECDNWKTAHPEWIFCDDFESSGPLVAPGRYFEYDDNGGDFAVKDSAGFGNSRGMRVRFQTGEVGAGSIKLAFGRNPVPYMNKQQVRPNEDFREIYYRMYLKMQAGWQGSPAKLSRATIFSSSQDWRQAMIAHLWSDANERLLIDPASCVNANGAVACTTYNDFDHLKWLGNKSGITPVFATANADTWYCIEHHVKLNDPGQSNGVQEFWINGQLEAAKTGLNFTGTYTEYAINAVFFENYWNSGSSKDQERYFDNIVVSATKIGPHNPAAVSGRSASSPRAAVSMRRLPNGAIMCSLPYPGKFSAAVYSLKGECRYSKENCSPGKVILDAKKLPSGIFIVKIIADGSSDLLTFTTRWQNSYGHL
jgi:hypothetical protein